LFCDKRDEWGVGSRKAAKKMSPSVKTQQRGAGGWKQKGSVPRVESAVTAGGGRVAKKASSTDQRPLVVHQNSGSPVESKKKEKAE